MYYNPETQEQITHSALKSKFNASIPATIEEFNGWYLLHEGERPDTSYTTRVVKGDIIEVNGKYYQTYTLEELLPSALQIKTRVERNHLLKEYVDPHICNVLKWDDLSEDRKDEIASYRQYLLNYPQSSDEWYKVKPLTFDEWKESQNSD